jgi:hypothetical protein
MQTLSANIQVLCLAQSVFLALILILGIGVWSRFHRQMDRLKRQQDATERTMRKFMEEAEKTFLEVCRLMTPHAHSSENGHDQYEESHGFNAGLDASSRGMPISGSLGKLGSARDRDKKAQVLNMFERGISTSEIGSCLNIPRGEIELIIDLKNKAGLRESRN